MKKFLQSLLILITLAAAIIFSWPSLFGLQRHYIFAQAVASRGLLAVSALVLLVICIILALLSKSLRPFLTSFGMVVGCFAAFNLFIAYQYGFEPIKPVASEEISEQDRISILSWNTKGDEPGAETIAKIAIQINAQIISLPETTEETTQEIAEILNRAGMQMQVFHRAFSQSAPAQSTGLLISEKLGAYELNNDIGDTSTLPTLVVENNDGARIVAVHAVAPTEQFMNAWKSDLYLLSGLCSGTDTIMVGDFNATLDHFIGLNEKNSDFGQCQDVAKELNAASIGTWPTDLPPSLSFAIDRVLIGKSFDALDFNVLDEFDDSGSDHRPVVAEIYRK